MNLWTIDFADRSEGLYTLKDQVQSETLTELVSPHIMLATNPDLESYAYIIPEALRADFFPVTYDAVIQGTVSADGVKVLKHRILVGNRWAFSGILRHIHQYGFEFSSGSGERVVVGSFGLGEPDD